MKTRGRGRRAQQGFSLIETLVAGAILLILAIGVLPLFIRSMAANAAGGELTLKTSEAGGRIEGYLPMNMSNPALQVATGTQLRTYSVFTRGGTTGASIGSDANRGWLTESTTAPVGWAAVRGPALWARETTIQNYNLQDLDTATLNYAGALPPGFPPTPIPAGAATSMGNVAFITVRLTNQTTRLADVTGGAAETRFIAVKSQ